MTFEIIKPSATLIGTTRLIMKDGTGHYDDFGSGEKLIEVCGRVCYRSEDRITADSFKGFIERLMKRGHLSVLEHASATFEFVTDRGVTHELVRHRLASFSQESTRYCRYGDEPIKIIEPPDLTAYEKMVWVHSVQTSCNAYNDLLAGGTKPEIARSVLPNCLAAKIMMTANFREWLHVIDLRTSKFAHPQIREIISMAAIQLMDIAPTVFGDYK